jgi:hypothetical protein
VRAACSVAGTSEAVGGCARQRMIGLQWLSSTTVPGGVRPHQVRPSPRGLGDRDASAQGLAHANALSAVAGD